MTALPTPPSRVRAGLRRDRRRHLHRSAHARAPRCARSMLAERFNVSRQPVQQALLLLRNQGMVREFGRRGLEVAPLDRRSSATSTTCARSSTATRPVSPRTASAPTEVEAHGARWSRPASRPTGPLVRAHDHRRRGLPPWVTDESGNPLLDRERGGDLAERPAGDRRGAAPRRLPALGAGRTTPRSSTPIAAGDGDRAERLARQHAEHGEQLILEALDGVRAARD